MMIGFVGDEMFDRRDRAGVEDASDVSLHHPRREKRIFAEVFEVSARLGVPVNVHPRSENDGDATGAAFLADAAGEFVGEAGIPRGGEGERIGKRGGFLQRVTVIAADVYARGGVGHVEFGHAELGVAFDVKTVVARDQAKLLLQRHLRQDLGGARSACS